MKSVDFETWVTNHKIHYNIAIYTKFFQYFLAHTLQTLVGMLRDASGRRWQTSQINSAE